MIHTCQLLGIDMRDKEKAKCLLPPEYLSMQLGGKVVAPCCELLSVPTDLRQSSIGCPGGEALRKWAVLGLLNHIYFGLKSYLFFSSENHVFIYTHLQALISSRDILFFAPFFFYF